MDKIDCFAYIEKTKECFALTEKNCEGCNFYKPAKNPEAVRSRMNMECFLYSKKERRR